MLRVGIGERFYTVPYGFEAGAARMRRQGYDAMDYAEFGNTETDLFRWNNREFSGYLRRQAAVCKEEGIEIFQTHGPWRYPPRDFTEEDRAERFEKMARAVEGTAILGCGNMVLHPLMPFTIHDEEHSEETRRINLEFFGRLCDLAKTYGVVINIENMPMRHFSLAAVPKILGVVKELDHAFLKVCLDTGHSTAIGRRAADDARLLGKDCLCSLHIHDNDGCHDNHWHPFAGVTDWTDFAGALSGISYGGVINLEVGRQKNLPRAMWEDEELLLYRRAEYLAEMAEKGGWKA